MTKEIEEPDQTAETKTTLLRCANCGIFLGVKTATMKKGNPKEKFSFTPEAQMQCPNDLRGTHLVEAI